jgi:hypothetical protein
MRAKIIALLMLPFYTRWLKEPLISLSFGFNTSPHRMVETVGGGFVPHAQGFQGEIFNIPHLRRGFLWKWRD